MKVLLNYAVLGFCPDLMDPNAKSIPLGIVGACVVGNQSRSWFFVIKNAVWSDPRLSLDPVSKSVLADLPGLLKRQVHDAASSLQVARFSSWLHGQFRNSLHVVSVDREVFNTKGVDPQREVMDHCMELYRHAVPAAKRRVERPMPAISFEPLPEKRGELVTA